MARELETAVLACINTVLDISSDHPTPEWLLRPGRTECAGAWPIVCNIYQQLTGRQLPDVMPSRERRRVDRVIETGAGPRIVEVDEIQHFNPYRAITIKSYPSDTALAFDAAAYLTACEAKARLERGGFARARPPLFPREGGRHLQRAFRDALCDLVPLEHGFLPTLRIAHFEVATWLNRPDAGARMNDLLLSRGVR